ncbi:endonuclease/exonuclease/phosphatase family protein, partial [Photobacterium sanctipauli]
WRFTTEAEIDETQTPDQIRVMAYNIWWAGAAPGGARSQEYVYEQMVENGVDIVLMQESYGYQQALADKLGFHLWPKTDAEGQNITVLSRFPILDELINDGRFVGVRLDIGEGREIDVYSTWLHYGDDTVNSAADPEITNEELTEIDFAADYSVLEAALPEFEASAQSTRPIIVGGDHNTISHLDYTDASNRYGRGQLSLPKSELFQNEGYIDSYREVYPDETKDLCFTWSPFHTSNPGQGRIDFIHYKGDQITAVEAKCLLNDGHQEFHPSDHGAVITTFSVNKANW